MFRLNELIAAMAQRRTFFDDVKKELDCSVCQEQFSATKEPKILKCLHTFCRDCLETWLARQREGKLSCPTCRQITECPNNDINRLPSNLFYKQLIDIVDAYSGGGVEDSPQCGNCEEKNYLKFYCSRCNCFLCEDCAGAHVKGKLFRGHQVKEIRNFQSSDVEDYARRANVCKKHDDEVRFFCVNCKICICRDCAVLEHQDHKKISIDEGLETNKSEIEAKMREVQRNDSRLRTHREALEKRRQKLSSDIDEATREVKRVASCCVSLIRKHEENVLQQLVKQKEDLQGSFTAQTASLDGKLTEIESTVAFCEEVLLRKNLPEILNVKTIIEERLRDLSLSSPEDNPKQDYSRVKYVSNDFSFAPGKLITSKTEPLLSVAEGKGVTEGIVGHDCSFTVITKDSASKDTYSEIDEVQVAITSVSSQHDVTEPVNMTLKDGRYTFSYRPTIPGEFTVSIKVAGTPIMGSPFTLTVKSKPGPGHKIRNRNTLENSSAPEIPSFEIEPKIVIDDHIKKNRPVLPAEDDGRHNHERIHKTVTDHTATATSFSPEIGSFDIEPKILKVFVKAHAKELDAIETKYKVEIPRLSKENKFTLKAKRGCSTEEFTEVCNLFIDLYQEMHQLIKMERFCLKREDNVVRAREEISKMGKQFPVSVEISKTHKQWEVYGEASHIEEALEYLKQKGIEIKRESKAEGNEKSTRKKLKHCDEEDMDVDQSEHSRGDSSSVDVIETYLGKVRLSVHKGDITNEQVDVIVNASNRELDHSGGVAMAILNKGGNIIKEESRAIIRKRGMLKDGEAVATKPGNLPCRAVVHVVGPRWDVTGATKSKVILHRACVNSLAETQKMKMTSIALPAIGSGMHGMAKDVCAEVMLDAVDKFVRQGDPKTKTITDIRFVNTGERSLQAFGKELKSRYGSDLVKFTPGKPVGARGGSFTASSTRSSRGKNYKGGEPDNNRSAKKPNHVSSSQPNYTSLGLSVADNRHPFSASGPSSYSGAVKGSADGADKHPPITHQPGGHEHEMGFSLLPAAGEDKTDSKKEKECPICLDIISNPQSLKCKHVFCSACLKTALDVSNKCPICQEPQGVLQGNQPQGEMRSRVERHQHLPGYEAYGTIVIDYRFPSGVQGREHPNPGQYYEGSYRAAYLPDNREGREVLQLLRKAFDARLVFTIGTSNTTGLENQITWNDIHHKTNIYGGPFRFGYPDPDYLRRVKEELAAKGIR